MAGVDVSSNPLTLDQSLVFVLRDLEARGSLAEQGNDSLAGVTADHGDLHGGGVLRARVLLSEGFRTNDVERCDAKEALGVEDAGGLENLGGDGDGGVDGVGDDTDEGVGAEFSDALGQVAHNAGIDLEKIITGHAGLAYSSSHPLGNLRKVREKRGLLTGNASGNHNNVGAGKGVLEAVILGQESGDFL